MAQSDNPHAIRLTESIEKHADRETAERIANKIALSKSADIDKKFLWAETTCADLEKEFDEKTVKEIRMDCACGPEEGKLSKLKKIYQACDGYADFAEKANKLEQGFHFTFNGKDLCLHYPQCYCSCVKRVDKPLSKTWCYCTLGYTKRMAKIVFDRDIEVELVESVKTGGKECILKMIL